MNANLERVKGKQVLTVFYDSTTCDWDNRISEAIAAYGLTRNKVLIVAEPRKEVEVCNPSS
jgi:hypothetical protein